MPETVPTILAVDYFAAPAGFYAQDSDTQEVNTINHVMGPSGNYVCSVEVDDGDTFRSRYEYCNASTIDLDTDLGVWATAFGDMYGSGVMDTMTITFEPGKKAVVEINGHQHNDNPHLLAGLRSADVSGIIPASSGSGVPALITVSTANTSAIAATLTFESGHVDKPGADGKHFYGQNITCRVSLSVSYEGTIATAGITAGNWLNIVIAKSGRGSDKPTSALTAEQFIEWN